MQVSVVDMNGVDIAPKEIALIGVRINSFTVSDSGVTANVSLMNKDGSLVRIQPFSVPVESLSKFIPKPASTPAAPAAAE